jgi:hypothetical protein
MTRLQRTARRALAAVAVLGLGAVVSACHHSDDDHGGMGQPPVGGTPNPPPVVTDAFVTYVAQVVATQDETSEPASIDGVAATAPEATEPQPLPGS